MTASGAQPHELGEQESALAQPAPIPDAADSSPATLSVLLQRLRHHRSTTGRRPLDAAAVKDGCIPLDKRRKEATLGVGAPRDQPPECLLRRQLVVHGRVVGAAALPGRAHFSPRPLNRGEREAASKAWSR